MKEIINVPQFPKAGPYSHAVVFNNMLFLSGQTGDGQDFKSQFEEAMRKITTILAEANSSLENVLKVTIYLASSNYFTEMNQLYGNYFKKDFPARTTVVVAFPNPKTLVEIDLIASFH